MMARMMKPEQNPNRHSLQGIKKEVDAARLVAEKKPDFVRFYEGNIMKRSELNKIQKMSSFGADELRKVMKAFQAHSNHDPVHCVSSL